MAHLPYPGDELIRTIDQRVDLIVNHAKDYEEVALIVPVAMYNYVQAHYVGLSQVFATVLTNARIVLSKLDISAQSDKTTRQYVDEVEAVATGQRCPHITNAQSEMTVLRVHDTAHTNQRLAYRVPKYFHGL